MRKGRETIKFMNSLFEIVFWKCANYEKSIKIYEVPAKFEKLEKIDENGEILKN